VRHPQRAAPAAGEHRFRPARARVVLAATGEMTGILALERNIAHRIIEESCWPPTRRWRATCSTPRPSLYRVHERPDPRRLEDFDATAQAFGYHLPRPFTPRAAHPAGPAREDARPSGGALPFHPDAAIDEAGALQREARHPSAWRAAVNPLHLAIRRYPDWSSPPGEAAAARRSAGARERGTLEELLPRPRRGRRSASAPPTPPRTS